MSQRTEFLYLSEEDMMKAGVLDIDNSVDVSEEIFSLLSKGDYLMGGTNHNSHGLGIVFPKETKFPNMPIAGPDRRFVAMPAYLGGRFNICGNKWYGSNAANKEKGLPRSVLTVMLNDKDTGEPLCLMAGNLLSATRTGAIPGVAVRHLARGDSEVCTVFGCGPINEACYAAIVSQVPKLKKVVCFDIFKEKAQSFVEWSKKEFGIDGFAANTDEEALRAGDIITFAASRLKPVFFEDDWIKKGTTVIFTGPAKAEETYWLNSKIIYDNTKLHEAYVEEAIGSGDKQAYYNGVIGGPLYKLIDEGKLPDLSKSISLGDIVLCEKAGREKEDERIAVIACGMAVFDVGWGYELYQSALKKGIGQKLLLWEKPYLS